MIIVNKTARTLRLVKDGVTLFECPVMLGENPEGHKLCEGDGRTPEGTYRVCMVNRKSKFHISLGISYPNRLDAKAAYRDKRIGLYDLCMITLADIMHLRPRWTSPLGGFIMLHGESPEGKTGDWTKGCIAVSNESIEQLASLVKPGERVVIEP